MTTATAKPTLGDRWAKAWTKDRRRIIVAAVVAALLVIGLGGLDPEDWFVTIMRGLATGAITFLVASGLSLILGLMDVLNLAHGELFMLGAYLGWTAYIRPDTTVDLLAPILITIAPFALWALWRPLGRRAAALGSRWAGWVLVAVGLGGWWWAWQMFPLAIWDPTVYAESPITYSLAFDTGTLVPLPAEVFGGPALLAILAMLVAASIAAVGLVSFNAAGPSKPSGRAIAASVASLATGLAILVWRARTWSKRCSG